MKPITGTGGAPIIGVMDLRTDENEQTLITLMLDGMPRDKERLEAKIIELIREEIA